MNIECQKQPLNDVVLLQKRGEIVAACDNDRNEKTMKEQVEYLVLPLRVQVRRVYIYRRRLNNEIEVYDMRAA